MNDLNDLAFFVHVVEQQGFAAAGRHLKVPKSTLSRRISGLEERLGVRLLQRSTRHFSVTEIGRQYYEHCKAMLVEAQAAEEVVERTRAEPCGRVRLSCPVALLHALVQPMLTDFLAQNPGVQLQLQATNRRLNLIDEGVDVAIRVRTSPLEDSELLVRVFSKGSRLLVASPALLAAHAPILTPADLAGLPSLGADETPHHWELDGPDGATARVPYEPRLLTDDLIALRDAAASGLGVVQLPLLLVQGALHAGEVQRVLPDWSPAPHVIHAVYPTRRGVLPSVRALLSFLEQRFHALGDV